MSTQETGTYPSNSGVLQSPDVEPTPERDPFRDRKDELSKQIVKAQKAHRGIRVEFLGGQLAEVYFEEVQAIVAAGFFKAFSSS